MKKLYTFLIVCLIFCVFAQAQNITNVYSEQDGKKINIFYTLDEESYISLEVSIDGGNTFEILEANISGDVGNRVTPGKKKIVWDVLSDRDKLWSEKVVFKVTRLNVQSFTSFTVGSVSFDMVYVEGGKFYMASDYQVTLTDYYIGKYEVTQALWEAVMGDNPSKFKGDQLPVDNVSWDDCQDFIFRLNQMTGEKFALPTEAQWEYAALGGSYNRGYEYSGSNTLGDVGWNWNNSGEKITKGDWEKYEQVSTNNCRTHPVGQKTPNKLWIYDMSGNVCEWCQDWYGSYSSSSQTNPTGPSSGSYRVLRGGSWNSNKGYCRVTHRYSYAPYNSNYYYGFRVVLLP